MKKWLDIIVDLFAALGAITLAHKVWTATLERFDVYFLTGFLFVTGLTCICGFLSGSMRLWLKRSDG